MPRAFVCSHQYPITRIPAAVRDALQLREWQAAVLEEYDALLKYAIWTLVPYEPPMKGIGKKMGFQDKT